MNPAHRPAVAAVDERRLADDEGAIALAAAIRIVGAADRFPGPAHGDERDDEGAWRPGRRPTWWMRPTGGHKPGAKDTSSGPQRNNMGCRFVNPGAVRSSTLMRTGPAGEESVEGRPSYDDLYDAHSRRLHRLCRLLLGDREEAEEVVQEVFLKLHKAQLEGTDATSWGAWLTRVAVNLCHDRRRAGWWPRWRFRTDRLDDSALVAREPSPEERAVGEETLRRIWTAFQRLSDRQREVFVLRHLEGWTTEEVAATLGLRTGSVKSHLFRAVRELRAAAGRTTP